jgi:hypothetical protein
VHAAHTSFKLRGSPGSFSCEVMYCLMLLFSSKVLAGFVGSSNDVACQGSGTKCSCTGGPLARVWNVQDHPLDVMRSVI